MLAFRALLVVMVVVLGAYTAVVIANHGLTLFPVFFGDIAAMTWAGQFNMDFMGFLIFSGLWVAWRHHFSPVGLVLMLGGLFGGIMFLAPYLLVMSIAAQGDMTVLLLGRARA